MTKRFWLNAASALTVLAGGAFLSTPAHASDVFGTCGPTQKAYIIGAIGAECNCGGVAYSNCNGYDIDIVSIQCYACG
jgi:hypothetical protein